MTAQQRERVNAAMVRGRLMTATRWAWERERRRRMAELTPERRPGRIVRRVIVIDDERTVREAVLWADDSPAVVRGKLREVLKPQLKV